MLIDRSSEVTENELDDIIATVQDMVDEAHEGTVFNVIAYDQTAETIVEPVEITGEESRDKIIEAIEKIAHSEHLPALDSAFHLALENIEAPTDTNNLVKTSNTIYVFSSGLNTGSDSDEPLDLVSAIGDKNVIVNIFAADDKTEIASALEYLTDKTRGIFRVASTSDEYFDAIEEADLVSSPDIDSLLATGDLLLKKGKKDIPFYVDNTLDTVNLEVSYEGDASTAVFTLIDPKGVKKIFGKDECGDVVQEADEDSVQENFCDVEISSPKVGKWTLSVNTVKQTNLNYVIDGTSKHGESKIFAQIDFDKKTNLVTASVSEKFPMTGLAVTGLLTRTNGKTSKFVLTDDGKGADRKANDGIYHGKLDKPATGEYSLDVVFDNQAGKAKITNEGAKYINGSTANFKIAG